MASLSLVSSSAFGGVAAARAPKPSLFSRIGQGLGQIGRSFSEAQQRRADRAIASLIERQGGRLTDDLERKLWRAALQSPWSGW